MVVEKAAGRRWGILDDLDGATQVQMDVEEGDEEESEEGEDDGDEGEDEEGGFEAKEFSREEEEYGEEGEVNEQSEGCEEEDETEEGLDGGHEDDMKGPSLSKEDKKKLERKSLKLPWELGTKGRKEFSRRFNELLLLPYGKHMRNPEKTFGLKSAHWVLLCSDVSLYLLDGLIGSAQLTAIAAFIGGAQKLMLNLSVRKDDIDEAHVELLRAHACLGKEWPLITYTRVMHSVCCHAGDSVELLGPGPLFAMWWSESAFGALIRALRGQTNLEQEIVNNETLKLISTLSSSSKELFEPSGRMSREVCLVNPSRWRDCAEGLILEDALRIMEEEVDSPCRVRWAHRCVWQGQVMRGELNEEIKPLSKMSMRSVVSATLVEKNQRGAEMESEYFGVPVSFFEVEVNGKNEFFVRVRWCNKAKKRDTTIGGLPLIKLDGREAFIGMMRIADLEDGEYTFCTSWEDDYDYVVVGFPKRISE